MTSLDTRGALELSRPRNPLQWSSLGGDSYDLASHPDIVALQSPTEQQFLGSTILTHAKLLPTLTDEVGKAERELGVAEVAFTEKSYGANRSKEDFDRISLLRDQVKWLRLITFG